MNDHNVNEQPLRSDSSHSQLQILLNSEEIPDDQR